MSCRASVTSSASPERIAFARRGYVELCHQGRSDAAAERLAELPPSFVCLSVITGAESLSSVKRFSAPDRLHIGVRQFQRIVRTLPWDIDAADWYADVRHSLMTAGQPIGDPDMMIAAHSLAVGAILVTNNARHFERIDAPLALVNWTKG